MVNAENPLTWKKVIIVFGQFALSVIVTAVLPFVFWNHADKFREYMIRHDLAFIHVLGAFTGAVTLFWTTVRYNQSKTIIENAQKQLAQSENQRKMTKLNDSIGISLPI